MSDRARDRARAALALATAVLAFHLAGSLVVRWYYATRLPHYDSIGAYTHVARLHSLVRQGEFPRAWDLAVHFHLSWLQSAFALATARWLPSTPAWVQLYNAPGVACAVYALYRVARDLGADRARACLASLAVFLPDALTCWDGGLVDLRRDAAFVTLLLAGVLLTLSYVWRPTAGRGLLAGLVAAMAVWSRGNAWPYLVLHAGPVLLFGAWRWSREGGRGRTLVWGGLAFALLAGVNLAYAAGPTIARYRNPVVSYALRGDPGQSLRAYAPAAWRLWANREPAANSTAPVFALACGLTAAWLLACRGLAGPWRLAPPGGRARGLLALGAWAVASTLGLLCLAARADARYGWGGIHPFYPVLLGPFAGCLVLAAWPAARGGPPGGRSRAAWALVFLAALVVPAAVGARAWCRARPAEPEAVAAAGRLHEYLRRHRPDAVVAFLSHDRVNYDTLAYLEALAGYDRARHLVKMRWQLPEITGAMQLDTACRFPAGGDVAGVTAALLRQTHERAHYVVVHADLAHYRLPADKTSFFFHHGSALVQALCSDEAYALAGDYRIAGPRPPGRAFLLLANTRLDPPAPRR